MADENGTKGLGFDGLSFRFIGRDSCLSMQSRILQLLPAAVPQVERLNGHSSLLSPNFGFFVASLVSRHKTAFKSCLVGSLVTSLIS
jgi:hypothetical protein